MVLRPITEPSRGSQACEHGGAFWSVLGDRFERLERAGSMVAADVLDAWFPPAPAVVEALRAHLPFLVRTSPPAACEGMIGEIARARGVEPGCIVPGDGSSALIFRALGRWLSPSSRVLLLDPTYGEYRHVAAQVAGAHVDSFPLSRASRYDVDPYTACHAETHLLRQELAGDLHGRAGVDVVPGVANFLLCRLPADGPDAAEVCERCRREGVFVRDVSSMSRRLGSHAVRIAVGERDANRRVVAALEAALRDRA